MPASNNPAEITKFLGAIETVDRSSFADENDRSAALLAARALCRRLEKPWDALINMTLTTPSLCAAAKTGMEMGLFKAMDTEPRKAKSIAQLAEICGGSEVLIGRLLKHLAASDLVSEIGPDQYQATLFTSSLQQGDTGSTLDFLCEMSGPAFLRLPEYLQKTEYKNPVNPIDGPWQYATDAPNIHFFAWLGAHAKEGKNFSNVMAQFTADKQDWTEIFPTEDLMRDDGAGEVVIVDVGGNTGADMQKLVKKHPELKGRVVVQDQAYVVEGVASEGIEYMTHDFFTPQPVSGATAYFLHAVLHDWSDEDCIRILSALKPAFGKGSRLLVNEMVIPATGAHPLNTSMDLTMMICLSTHERTESNWKNVFMKAGYALTAIHRGRTESVIEATVM